MIKIPTATAAATALASALIVAGIFYFAKPSAACTPTAVPLAVSDTQPPLGYQLETCGSSVIILDRSTAMQFIPLPIK